MVWAHNWKGAIMSKERKEEIQRQGFIDAFMGIEPNLIMDQLPADNPYRQAYRYGRNLGRKAMVTDHGIKIRNKLEAFYNAAKADPTILW